MNNFWIFWQNLPTKIDPLIFEFKIFSIRWYSLGYLMAFMTFFILIWWRIKKNEFDSKKISSGKIKEIILDVFFSSFFGMMVGARLGYFLFYDWQTIFSSPGEIFIPGKNGFFGFSFHGGLLGAWIGAWIYCYYHKISFKALSNLILPAIPLGLFWGRLGNFFNHELFGNETTRPWGMHFTDSQTLLHPSQLYEALGEGVILFVIIWTVRNKKWAQNNLLSIFLIFYGSIRFVIEFFRESPSDQSFLNLISTGQLLCLAMIVVGLYLSKFSLKTCLKSHRNL